MTQLKGITVLNTGLSDCNLLVPYWTTQIANIIGPTLHIDWVIGVWLRSHVHDWTNVGAVVHLHAIFADVGPILANDLLLQRIIKEIFFHRNKSGRIFVSHFNKRCTYTQQASLGPVVNIIIFLLLFFSTMCSL